MELRRGTAPKVKFYAPTDDTTIDAVTYSINGGEEKTGIAVEATAGDKAFELQLPYLESHINDIVVTWNFAITAASNEFYAEKQTYEVITPYLSKNELKAIFDDQNPSDEDLWQAEAAARHVIDAFTGQSFGFVPNKTITLEGHGEHAVKLPQRLINLSGISTLTSVLEPRAAIVVSDGWYLKKGWAHELSPISNESAYWGEYHSGVFDNNIYSDPDGDGEPPIVGPLNSRPGGVIVAPGGRGQSTPWKDDYPFAITGDWGYKQVPAAVKEAAKLLVNDYACGEALWRDRYLKSIYSADWRIEFSSRSWESTGNVRADQLLSEYVMMDWIAI